MIGEERGSIMGYIVKTPEEIQGNVFSMIGSDWMLVTAQNGEKYNTMTASWGGMGVLWGKPVAFIFIRPQRYTYTFLENTDRFTLSFFGGACRDALALCGRVSGRDTDKIREAGLVPFSTNDGYMSFREASVILECRKLYADFIKEENMLDTSLMEHYKAGDFHKMYIAEITRGLIQE
jgi:conserved protein/domain typically associated with flavoprotein oxygenases, DIM6/NTAB family